MFINKDTAKKTAELLLQVKAIKLNPKKPFIWASGWKSPIYCDNRITLSYPNLRNYLKENLTDLIKKKYGKPDVIAGIATGGIAMGVLVAQELEVPFVYVRPEPKKYGRKNQIEGQLNQNKNIVVIEDLISTGKSCLNAVKILKKENNSNIKGVVAIFSYGFNIAKDNFANEKIKLNTLCNYDYLLDQALESKYINTKELDTLKKWKEDPINWNQ